MMYFVVAAKVPLFFISLFMQHMFLNTGLQFADYLLRRENQKKVRIGVKCFLWVIFGLLLVRSLYEYAFKAIILLFYPFLTDGSEWDDEKVSQFLTNYILIDHIVILLMNFTPFAIAWGISGTFLYFGTSLHERNFSVTNSLVL